MGKINLVKALKKKSKLISQIEEVKQRVRNYNSFETENKDTVPYNSKDEWEKFLTLSQDLIELKTEIALANAPIQGNIFAMSEIKNQITALKSLNIVTGNKARSYSSSDVIDWTSTIGIKERDSLVSELELKLEDHQSVIESHNASVTINVK